MLPLNHKRTTSSLVPPIFYVAKKFAIERYKAPHCQNKRQNVDPIENILKGIEIRDGVMNANLKVRRNEIALL
jgi:hypothetical protein